MNLGFGLGGLTGGLIATANAPGSFTVLFLLDAATFVAFAAILTRLPSPAPHSHERPGSYRNVLRNRAFMRFAWLNVVFIAAGVVLLSELLPVFVKNEAGVDESLIGVFFLVHTAAIVVAQLPITKWSEGRRRMVALAAMAVSGPSPGSPCSRWARGCAETRHSACCSASASSSRSGPACTGRSRGRSSSIWPSRT